jgi:hypothetical protein
MPRLMWTAWTAVLLIACLSCRTNPGVVPDRPMLAATGGSGQVCVEYGDCLECLVEILHPLNRTVLYSLCGDDEPGECCPCQRGGECCGCQRPGGDPSVLPPTPDGKYIVRVGPAAVVTLKREGKPTQTHHGPVEFTTEAPLPMEVTCR